MDPNTDYYIKFLCYNQDMYLGIDIGGTKTLVALFSKRGRIVKRVKFKTAQGDKTFLSDLLGVLRGFQGRKILAVVVAVPGVVQKNYTVRLGNREWGDFDVLTPIKNLFNCPVWLENDGNLGALFEGYRLGGRTVFLTFSTGIGGGIVENNRILPQSNSFEPGHKKYWYNGKIAEWEDIAAASALEKFYHVDQATDLRGKTVMKDVAERVMLGLETVILRYQPDNIVLGGPLGKIFKLYAKYLTMVPGVRYLRPKRPTESVIYGCFLLAKQKMREQKLQGQDKQ